MDKKDIPYWDTRKFFWQQTKSAIQFFQNEYNKILNGVNLGGYYMSGWMYFHINFFQTTIIDPKTLKKSIRTSPLDDNTYYLMECYKEATEKGLGLCMWGTRGFGKSTFIGSIKHWTHLTKDGTSMLVYKEGNDLSSIRDMITTSMSNIHPAFKLNILRGSGDWKDTDVVFGNSTSHNEEFIKSQLRVINASGGAESASEKGAGLTPIGYVMDEALAFDSILHLGEKEITMEEITIGDEIYGDDGKLTTVLDKIDVGVVPMYEFTLSDGRKVESSEDHVWRVKDKRYKKEVDLRTSEIVDKYKAKKFDSRYDKYNTTYNFSIPLAKPVNYPEKDLPIEPYFLGLWLGDGITSKPSVCSADKEIKEYIKSYAGRINCDYSEHFHKDVLNFSTIRIKSVKGTSGTGSNPVINALRELGIYSDKNIPEIYLKASVEQRLDLLRGLMDSDGHRTDSGDIEFTSCIPKLVETFKTLIHSLGIRVSIKEKKLQLSSTIPNKYNKKVTRFYLMTDLEVFKLSRKLSSKTYTGAKRKHNIAFVNIVDVRELEPKQAYCIKASNKSSLFLVNQYIITHNCGKYDPVGIFNSAKASFKYQNKSLFTYILAGTAGNEALSEGAKTMLMNPKDYDLLIMNWDTLNNIVPDEHITWKEDVGRKFGIFVPGQMSYRENEPKLEKTFGEFSNDKFDSDELNSMKINVTDWKATKEVFERKLNDSSDESVKTKQRMYYPMCIDDSFLTSKVNPFDAEAITRKLRQLKEKPKHTLVDFEIDPKTNKITTTFQSDKPLAERGHKKTISAPYMIFDNFPKEVPPKFKFVSGADDYKSADATTESLGAIYVLERRTINMPLEKIAACLVERPATHREMHSKWEKLIRGTQAICNLEAADTAFVSYLEDVIKVDGYQYLHPFINPHAALANKNKGKVQSNYKFGTYPHQWNVKILFDTVIDYTQQTFTVGFDPETNAQIINCGIDLIDDPMLLQEMLDFKYGSGNYDRLFSFGWALILARHLDSKNIMPEDKHVEKYNNEMFSKQTKRHSNFGKSSARNF